MPTTQDTAAPSPLVEKLSALRASIAAAFFTPAAEPRPIQDAAVVDRIRDSGAWREAETRLREEREERRSLLLARLAEIPDEREAAHREDAPALEQRRADVERLRAELRQAEVALDRHGIDASKRQTRLEREEHDLSASLRTANDADYPEISDLLERIVARTRELMAASQSRDAGSVMDRGTFYAPPWSASVSNVPAIRAALAALGELRRRVEALYVASTATITAELPKIEEELLQAAGPNVEELVEVEGSRTRRRTSRQH